MTILTGWREQYERMRRSHERLRGIAEGRERASSDAARDALFHFFQDAYYLKDWIKNDSTIEMRDVEKWIDNTEPLQLCADLCNGTKHFKLTRTRTNDTSTAVETQSATVRPSTIGSGRSAEPPLHGWTVQSDSRSRDAIDLSDDVVSAWQSWLRDEGFQ